MIDLSVSDKTSELFQKLERAASRSNRAGTGHPAATADPLSNRYRESIQIVEKSSLESKAGATAGFATMAGKEDPRRSIALKEIMPTLEEMLMREITAI